MRASRIDRLAAGPVRAGSLAGAVDAGGFLYDRDASGVRIGIPHWLPLSASLCVLTYCQRRRRADQRVRDRLVLGLCTACGYDLRASAGRCPECGAPRMASTRPVARVTA